MLLHILIVLFVSLILYQIYLEMFKQPLIEGLENEDASTTEPTPTASTTPTTTEPVPTTFQPYNLSNPNNSLILAQQNAGNIQVLKGRIDDLDGVKNQVNAMQQSLNSMQIQMDQLVQQQADYAQELAGSSPPTITGTEPETLEDVEEDI
jgi:TolA-binding protein